MSASDPLLDEIAATAQRLGWSLSDDEAAKLAKGVSHNRRWGEDVRTFLQPELEPAVTYAAKGQ